MARIAPAAQTWTNDRWDHPGGRSSFWDEVLDWVAMPVREATIDDVPAILPLLRAYTDFYETDPSDEGLESMVRDVIGRPGDQAFILVASAEPDGEVVGFAACVWKWSSLRGARIVFLDDLFVHPDARGSGLADELIKAIAGIARAGDAPIVAWLTATDNKRAHKVYDRVGGRAETLIEYELEL